MSHRIIETIIVSSLLVAGPIGCGDTKHEEAHPEGHDPAAGAQRKDEAAAKKEAPAEAGKLDASTMAAIDEALREYETIRTKLAADETAGLAEAAKKIADAAAGAVDGAPEHLRPLLQKVADQAKALATAGADIEQNRLSFGEVSRALVGLIIAQPSLQEGRFVFQCPMAKGYKKWVQVDAELENPYMGKRMPKCGSRSDWEV